MTPFLLIPLGCLLVLAGAVALTVVHAAIGLAWVWWQERRVRP